MQKHEKRQSKDEKRQKGDKRDEVDADGRD